MKILGIETSCDETSVAIVTDERRILSHLVLSQLKDHAPYGGVVPEIASRAHLDHLDHLIKRALDESGASLSACDGFAATCGPGLIGGVMVGMMAGKSLALAQQKPFIAINHLEGHVLSPRLVRDIPFPYLVLLVSGGHTQILVAEDIGLYHIWASTLDDAIGECFDKAAKLMGLPYPGGPHLEKLASLCKNPEAARVRFPFSIPMERGGKIGFSFSGLKTSVRMSLEKLGPHAEHETLSDLASSFQSILSETLERNCVFALQKFNATYPTVKKPYFVVCGGVAANGLIRSRLLSLAQDFDFQFLAPPKEFCTDNAAMIAWAGIEHLKKNWISPLDTKARPRWPLEELQKERHNVSTQETELA
jgi:N6-L-threonylcarbamoyladenine synthase